MVMMAFLPFRAVSLLVLAVQSLAATLPAVVEESEDPATILARQDSACRNGPYTRMCWEAGFSIATDFDAVRWLLCR